MAQSPRPVALAAARERAIELLSAQFAEDRLTIDELDVRLERAYAATSFDELNAVVADLAPAETSSVLPSAPDVGQHYDVEPTRRIFSVMSESKRRGLWAVPDRLDVTAIMSDLTLDLRSALLNPGVTDIHVRAIMSAVRVFVPPGVRVVGNVRPFMASVTDDSYANLSSDPDVPVIRLTGSAVMAEVSVRTKARLVRE